MITIVITKGVSKLLRANWENKSKLATEYPDTYDHRKVFVRIVLNVIKHFAKFWFEPVEGKQTNYNFEEKMKETAMMSNFL